MMEFPEFAPAKVNLSLRILGQRPDGYHDLESLMVPLTVGDRLKVRADTGASGGPTLRLCCEQPDVPTGAEGLMDRSFRYAADKLGFSGWMEVWLEKRLPIGAGLGGGSSDAAALIRAVAKVTAKSLAPALYPEIAQRLGADIPFFLAEGPCWVEGIGERLRPADEVPTASLILVNPGIHISTPWAYREFDSQLTTQAAIDTSKASSQSFGDGKICVTNDLESVVLPHHPVLAELKARFISLGADAALMSGSGSTVFGLFSDENERDAALKKIQAVYPEFWIQGAEVLV